MRNEGSHQHNTYGKGRTRVIEPARARHFTLLGLCLEQNMAPVTSRQVPNSPFS